LQIANHNLSASLGQDQGDTPANALGCARNYGHLSV
jgi:hypothetical protein